MGFTETLDQAQESSGSMLCVGLDPDPDRMPNHLLRRFPIEDAVIQFNAAIIEATAPVACAYKLNLAFYEVLGQAGFRTLKRTLDQIPSGKVTIADAKRGDIGNSARMYARVLFEKLGCDACTVAPYMGRDAVEPFLQYPDRAAFVLARTSNPGSSDFQEVRSEGEPLYLRVARAAAQWSNDHPGTAGLVVGATQPASIREIREACPSLPFLLPGVGAQGGDPVEAITLSTQGGAPALVNSSRSILYASTDQQFARAAHEAARELRDTLSQGRPA